MQPSDDFGNDPMFPPPELLPFDQSTYYGDMPLSLVDDEFDAPGAMPPLFDADGMKRSAPAAWGEQQQAFVQLTPEAQSVLQRQKVVKLEGGGMVPALSTQQTQPGGTGAAAGEAQASFMPPTTSQPLLPPMEPSGAPPQAPQYVSLPVPAQLAPVAAQPALIELPDAQQREEMAASFMRSGVRAARTVLDTIAADLGTVRAALPQIRAQQRAAIAARCAEQLQALMAQESEMVGRIKVASSRTEELERDHVLLPGELRATSDARQDAYIMCEQLNLYLLEAQQKLADSAGVAAGSRGAAGNACVASLVITSQPFPLVLSKGKLVDAPLDVAILTGSVQELKQAQHFEPIITTEPAGKVVAQKVVSVAKEEALSTSSTRLKVKMMNGSRMLPVCLKMSIAVAFPGGSVVLESQVSQPFIVITNENQYEESNGSLLRHLAFGSNPDTPWPRFANELQRHFIQATKQDGAHHLAPPPQSASAAPAAAATAAAESLPVRPLAVRELEYIHNRFFAGRSVISVSQFDQFWAWFGKILQRMRSTRQICGMWRDGLLWGFVGRSDIERALLAQPPGSFVVRFSERHAGHFAIAYRSPFVPVDLRSSAPSEPATPCVHPQPAAAPAPPPQAAAATAAAASGGVKHYLVKPEELSAQKTLPDFLRDTAGLSFIVRVLHNDFGTELDPPAPLPEPLYIPVPKAEALSKFLSKREQITLVGYEPNLAPIPPMPVPVSMPMPMPM